MQDQRLNPRCHNCWQRILSNELHLQVPANNLYDRRKQLQQNFMHKAIILWSAINFSINASIEMKIARQRVYGILQHPHAIFRSGAYAIYSKQIQINAIKTTVTTGGMAERYLLPGLTLD